MRSSGRLLGLPILLLCSGCGSYPEPEIVANGAFTFVDGGESAGMDRYQLFVAEPLDLGQSQVVRHELEWCPDVDLVGYLDLAFPLSGRDDKGSAPWAATVFELRLEDAEGKVLFRDKGPLRDWTWSGRVGGSTTSLYTSKTMFKPEVDGPFFLVAEVEAAGEGAPAGTLALRGGGWKLEGEPMPLSTLFH